MIPDDLPVGRLTYRTSDGQETWFLGDQLVWTNQDSTLELRILLANAVFVADRIREELNRRQRDEQGYGVVTIGGTSVLPCSES